MTPPRRTPARTEACRRSRRRRITAAALIGVCLHSATAWSAPDTCADKPELVAPCFEVRGRLSWWNGAPSARIWRVGTTRMLGIRHDELPAELAAMRGFDTEILGTFSVCPFTYPQTGHLQFVCIDAWRDIAVRRRTGKVKAATADDRPAARPDAFIDRRSAP